MRHPSVRSIASFVLIAGVVLILARAGRRASPIETASRRPSRIVQSEVHAIYAPQALIDFARRTEIPVLSTNADLKRAIALARLEHVWYGVTIRDFTAAGAFQEEAVVDRPGVREASFGRTRSILYALAGGREPWGAFDPARVQVVVIPEAMIGGDPASVLADLREVRRAYGP